MRKNILIFFATFFLSSCSSMSTLEDIENTKPLETVTVDREISQVYKDISRNTKFCFANNSSTNYTVHTNLDASSGEILVMTGAEIISADIWLAARLTKQGNKTIIKYTVGSPAWSRWVKKMKIWSTGKSGC